MGKSMTRVIKGETQDINKIFDLCRQMAEDMKIAGYDDMDEPWAKEKPKNNDYQSTIRNIHCC